MLPDCHFSSDDTGALFTCDECHNMFFMAIDEFDDEELFDMAFNDELFVCTKCAEKYERKLGDDKK